MAIPAPAPRSAPIREWLGLSLVVLLAYLPAVNGGLVWDDDGHVTRPELRSLHGLWRIWTELGATQQYYPVLHSAFWIEHRLWGDATLGYHLVNILLHATAAWLFVTVLRRLVPSGPGEVRTGLFDGPLLAGLLFALHPVCTESVAWISEQKNTLSTVFYLLAALTYLKGAARCGGETPAIRRPLYLLSLALFAAALLSKSVTATLPAALLVVIWWRRGRLELRRDVLPLLPFFAVGVSAGLLTAWVERRYGGAEGAVYALGALQRCLLAGRVIWFYLAKLAWPANLAFIYPHWRVDAGDWRSYAFPVAALAALAILWRNRGRGRGPLAAALFFAGSLFPALGFFNVYPFAYSYVADHFQYLASLGIFAAAGIGWGQMRGSDRGKKHLLITNYSFPISFLLVLAALTWRQSGQYRDSETLYRATIDRNPECWMAHTNLGVALAASGRTDEAIAHYEKALSVDPSLARVHNDLGSALFSKGRPAQALAHIDEALRLQPRFPAATYNRAITLQALGRTTEAIDAFFAVLRMNPNFFEARYNLALALAGAGRTPEAADQFERAIALRPGFPATYYNLGMALRAMGREGDADVQFQKAGNLGFRP